MATINKKKLLSRDKLIATFKMFDIDNSGSISVDEVKMILGVGKKFSDTVWEQVISEVDQNKDGQISFDEFEKMMSKFLV